MNHLIIIKQVFVSIVLLCFSCNGNNVSEEKSSQSKELEELNNRLAKGWNTWNTRSVLSYVLLPECFAINLQLQKMGTNEILTEALIGRRGEGKEKVKPGAHSYNGSYTELNVAWNNQEIKVESASEGSILGLRISPVKSAENFELLIKPEILWGRAGDILINKSDIHFSNDSGTIDICIKGLLKSEEDTLIRCSLKDKIFLCTRADLEVADIENLITKARNKHFSNKAKYKSDSLLYEAMQTVLAWDVIYEPVNDRVIAPVSRIWCTNPIDQYGWGGWVLFDWDTYFASLMFALDNKELAYSNAIAITKEITKNGFIPNFGSGIGKSEDRSQPPVGSFVVKEIYNKYKEKWFLEEVFDELISWNRWWKNNRDFQGYLCWGTNPYDTKQQPGWLAMEVGKIQAAKWESGLDNSPMYDEAEFDSSIHLMMLADVGLLSLYIWDCKNLAEIARILDRKEISAELEERAAVYGGSLKTLWNDEFGLFLNKDLITGKFSYRLSPTLFYPLLTGMPDQKQAKRMIDEHFYNPYEFWGEWIIPSIARNDNAFKDNFYWRGRIWAPMNFLVYLGLRNYDLHQARKDLKEKSANLILKSWLEEKHVYENYNAINGVGDDVYSSDKFYHWGGLLAYISLVEDGYALRGK